MRSKTSCFNGAVYLGCLGRGWPVWGAAILVWCLILPVPTLSGGSRGADFARDLLLETGFAAGAILCAMLAIAAAMVVFSFLYQAKSTSFMAALPLRREGLFLSAWLAGFTMLAGVGVVTAVLTLLAQLAANALCPAAVLGWLGLYLLQALCFYGLASFCALLTGCLWVLPLLYIALNFLVISLWMLISGVLDKLVFGFRELGEGLARTLTPLIRMLAWQWEPDYPRLLALALYALGGLVLSALALLLFRRRRMEAASDVVAVRALKPAFRWCLAIASALTFANLLYELTMDEGYRTGWMLLFALIGGLVGWLSAEMLNRKSFRVRHTWPGFAVFAIVLSALIIGCGSGCFGYERFVPDQGEITVVDFDYGGTHGEVTASADLALLREVHTALTGRKGESGVYQGRLYLSYTLRGGRVVQRDYRLQGLPADMLARLDRLAERVELEGLLALELDKAAVVDGDVYFADGEGGSRLLDFEEAGLLFRDCILPDLRDGGVHLTDYGWNAAVEEQSLLASVTMEFQLPREDERHDYIRYAFQVGDPESRTWQALQALR